MTGLRVRLWRWFTVRGHILLNILSSVIRPWNNVMRCMSFYVRIFCKGREYSGGALMGLATQLASAPQIARFMVPPWGPPGSCRPQMGPMLAPWTLLSGSDVSMTLLEPEVNAFSVYTKALFYMNIRMKSALTYSNKRVVTHAVGKKNTAFLIGILFCILYLYHSVSFIWHLGDRNGE